MMKRYIVLTGISGLLLMTGWWLACPQEAAGEPIVRKATVEGYDFGTLMMDFVKNEASQMATAHMPDEYAGRSLNGMQITLDKIREHANGAAEISSVTNTLMEQQAAAMRRLQNIEAGMEPPPSGEVVAEIAGVASRARDACYNLAYRWEIIKVMKQRLGEIQRPMTFLEFKQEDLHLVPLNYIMTSVGGSRPDFDQRISASVSLYSDGENVTVDKESTAGFFLLDAWAAYKDEKEYEEELEKYYKALRLLPGLLPADTTCFRVYSEGYEVARGLYRQETELLGHHLDSLVVFLEERYKVMQSLRRGLENGLLSARVRAASRHLSIESFNAGDLTAIRTKAFALRKARSLMEVLRDTAMFGKNSANIYFALEEMKENALEVTAVIREMDSVALYEPLRPFLADNKKWFITWGNWAAAQISAGNVRDTPLIQASSISADAVLKSMELALKNKQASNKKQLKAHLMQVSRPAYQSLSVAYNWPGDYSGAAHHTGYSYMGREVWSRGTDGAFVRDNRKSGQGRIGHVKENLRERARETSAKYRESLALATAARETRENEIGLQLNDVRGDNRRTQTAAAEVPVNYSAVPLPAGLPQRPGGGMETLPGTPVTVANVIPRERERNRLFLLSLPEATRNSPAIRQYSETHDMYLAYAEALSRDGYLRQADNMADAAIAMRATLRGFDMSGVRLPVFDVPDIPFNPFTGQDWQYVYERHLDYVVVSDNLGDRSQWFKAAGMVTDLNELGLADMPPISFSTAAKFLREGNQYLYPFNMQNGAAILQGTLQGSFVTPDNELIVLDGLKGRELDYALVAFEQSKVQVFIDEFRQRNPGINMDLLFLQINTGMRINPVSTSVLRRAMFNSFRFQHYSDRVRLGRRIIDELYKLKPRQ